MRNKTKKIIAMMLSLVFALSMVAASSLAVAGPTANFDTYLVLDADASVPNATFNYTIEPIPVRIVEDGKQTIEMGLGKPVLGSAVFAPSDTVGAKTSVDTEAGDILTLSTGEKYVKKEVSVNMSGIDFPAPGIYRYEITRTAPDPAIPGVTLDANETRYLDVYVNSADDGTLSIQGSFLHTGAGNTDAKSGGYTNKYATNELTISKTVSGNQAFRSKLFKFTVEITADAGTVFQVDFNGATLTAPDGVTGANPTTLTVPDEATSVTGIFYLKHNQSIDIKGMVLGTDYKVSEENEDYTATYKLNGATKSSNGHEVTSEIVAGTNSVAFDNHREGTVPTGILMDVAPYVLIVTLAGAMLLVLLMKKRKTAR